MSPDVFLQYLTSQNVLFEDFLKLMVKFNIFIDTLFSFITDKS